jgi:hypothetical protein
MEMCWQIMSAKSEKGIRKNWVVGGKGLAILCHGCMWIQQNRGGFHKSINALCLKIVLLLHKFTQI